MVEFFNNASAIHFAPCGFLPLSGKTGPLKGCDWGGQNRPSMGIPGNTPQVVTDSKSLLS